MFTLDYKPRKPLIASLMSLSLPGFGQLYNGQLNKAVWLYLLFALLITPVLTLVAVYLPSALMLPALVLSLMSVLGIWGYGVWDAWCCAKAQTDYVLKPWQVTSFYPVVFIVGSLVILPLLIHYVRAYQVESFYIPSSSMEPSLMRGDVLFADKRYNCGGCALKVERGDIAIFTYPNERTTYYIKRIIGLPNDTIQLNQTQVLVNGTALQTQTAIPAQDLQITESINNKTWQVQWTKPNPSFKAATFTVPAGQVFVLGDNRDGSVDSREFGTVPLPDVVGKAKQIWFSRAEGTMRWERLGKVIE